MKKISLAATKKAQANPRKGKLAGVSHRSKSGSAQEALIEMLVGRTGEQGGRPLQTSKLTKGIASVAKRSNYLPQTLVKRKLGHKRHIFEVNGLLLEKDPLEEDRRLLALLSAGHIGKAKKLMDIARKRDRVASQRIVLQAESRYR